MVGRAAALGLPARQPDRAGRSLPSRSPAWHCWPSRTWEFAPFEVRDRIPVRWKVRDPLPAATAGGERHAVPDRLCCCCDARWPSAGCSRPAAAGRRRPAAEALTQASRRPSGRRPSPGSHAATALERADTAPLTLGYPDPDPDRAAAPTPQPVNRRGRRRRAASTRPERHHRESAEPLGGPETGPPTTSGYAARRLSP